MDTVAAVAVQLPNYFPVNLLFHGGAGWVAKKAGALAHYGAADAVARGDDNGES